MHDKGSVGFLILLIILSVIVYSLVYSYRDAMMNPPQPTKKVESLKKRGFFKDDGDKSSMQKAGSVMANPISAPAPAPATNNNAQKNTWTRSPYLDANQQPAEKEPSE